MLVYAGSSIGLVTTGCAMPGYWDNQWICNYRILGQSVDLRLQDIGTISGFAATGYWDEQWIYNHRILGSAVHRIYNASGIIDVMCQFAIDAGSVIVDVRVS